MNIQNLIKLLFILSIIALLVAVVYDYLTPGGAAVSGVALRLVLFELRRILIVIVIVLAIAFFMKYGGDIQKAKAIVEGVSGLVNSGIKYLDAKK